MPDTKPTPTPPIVGRLFTPRQIAEQLQCSYSMALALIRRGQLPAIYVGRLPRIRATDLAEYIHRGGDR